MTDAKTFAEAFIGRLAANDFCADGCLLAYLDRPEAERSGDEADMVDARVTRTLVNALGYSDGEFLYNRNNEGQRPDYVLRIKEYPLPCLIIEDKSTAEANLARHRTQLAAYMTGLRCPRGVLTDGKTLFAYEAAGASTAPSLRFSVVAAVRAWRGEDLLSTGKAGWEALGRPDQDALAVLLRRYGRAAFAGVTRLLDDLMLDRNGAPHAQDGSTWHTGAARIAITDVRDAPDALVDAIQSLIAELREDVAVQFAVAQEDYTAFLAETAKAPGSSMLADDVITSLSTELLGFLPERARDQRAELERRFRAALRGERPLAEVDEVAAEVRRLANGRAGAGGSDVISRAASAAKQFANRYAAHRARATARHEDALATVEAHQRWRTALGVLLDTRDEGRARDEYFAQTAYVVIVRMLLVRILEDKGLTKRIFTNGGTALWFGAVEERYFSLSMGRSAARLLEIAYENAQATYAHFYDGHRVFDWYTPDRSMMVRVLHRLAGFDLRGIDRDIIGTVYGRFVNDRHKHEQGMYYTPPGVVSFILDRVGWRGREIVGKRLLDPACGSGAFLVEGARRLVEAYRADARAGGHTEIPPARVQEVLDEIGRGVVGFDLNPFACALAEINLLVQVLELVAHAQAHGSPVRLDRFRIYNTDALRPTPQARAAFEGALDPLAAGDLPDEEQAKLRVGVFADGFDAVVANPPYVRADEGSPGQAEYRAQVAAHPIPAVREVLTHKWDLFVPFVALGRALLAEGGRMGMIVSNAVETVLYARKLRQALAEGMRVDEVHFFDGRVRLFEDAAVRNTIVVATAAVPGDGHAVLREWHTDAPPRPARRQSLLQRRFGEEVFRPALPSVKVVPGVETRLLKEVCYITKGMVLHGEGKDKFKIDDLVSDVFDAAHPKPFVTSQGLRIPNAASGRINFAPARIKFVEWNSPRVPSSVSRPTFPELYDRPKIMVGEFGGALLDDGAHHQAGFLACNHSVFLFLRWRDLAGVNNRSLADRADELRQTRNALEGASDRYPLPFLVGLFNSATWEALLAGSLTTSIAGRVQPTNYADQSIPLPTPEQAAAVGARADAARDEGRALAALLAAGWERRAEGWHAPAPQTGQTRPFATARTRWGFTVRTPGARCDRLRRDGARILAGSTPAVDLPDGLLAEAADFLLRVLLAHGRATLGTVEANGVSLLLDPAEAAAAERKLTLLEAEALARERRILALRGEIDALLAPLFAATNFPPVESVVP